MAVVVNITSVGETRRHRALGIARSGGTSLCAPAESALDLHGVGSERVPGPTPPSTATRASGGRSGRHSVRARAKRPAPLEMEELWTTGGGPGFAPGLARWLRPLLALCHLICP